MTESILWYVHAHGDGHLQRFRAVVPHLDVPVVVCSARADLVDRTSDLRCRAAVLSSDVDSFSEQGPGPFHHSPQSQVARRRMHELLDLIDRHHCTTAVVDVSVETVVACRLAGMRIVALRQSGYRADDGHRLAHACADAVWVPQHRALEPFVGDLARVHYSGAFSRHDPTPIGRAAARLAVGWSTSCRHVVMVVGRGGTRFPISAWRAGDVPGGTQVHLVGLEQRWRRAGVESLGWVRDPQPLFAAADVVLTSAGWSSVHDVASARARMGVVAEDRPFDEQLVRARALHEAGLVVALDRWPEPSGLAGDLERIEALDPATWETFYDRSGAARAAEIVRDVHGDGG